MLHPGAGGWFTQQHWPLTPQSHRWTAHYYYHEPVNMTERLAIAQATAFARDSGMEDFMIMARQQKGLASGATDSFYYGEAEMLPRHRAAVIRSVLDGVPTLMRSVACPPARTSLVTGTRAPVRVEPGGRPPLHTTPH